MSFDLADLAAVVARQGRVVRVVVAGVAGSAPREVGAAMLVWADGQSGTIGGGALEHAAARAARQLLAAGGGPLVTRAALGPALGQCCGGAVTLVSEPWDRARLAALGGTALVVRRVEGASDAPLAVRRLQARARGAGDIPAPALIGGWLLEPVLTARRLVWVWGAGHVGRALVGVLAPLPGLALTWVDVAADRFPTVIPAGVEVVAAVNPADLVAHAPVQAEHLILTYSHALDLDLCHRLLAHGFAGLGLIGSATKAARFHARLRALGHSPEALARLTCPIGDPALGKHPQAIAVGVAAALLRQPMATARPLERSA